MYTLKQISSEPDWLNLLIEELGREEPSNISDKNRLAAHELLSQWTAQSFVPDLVGTLEEPLIVFVQTCFVQDDKQFVWALEPVFRTKYGCADEEDVWSPIMLSLSLLSQYSHLKHTHTDRPLSVVRMA